MLGGGIFLQEMQALAKKLECSELIHFAGEVEHADVIQYLDNADAFVMPSRTEGLPRALIEAMARGLPCIASNVGGIPELLDNATVVENNNWSQLAQKIHGLLSSPESMSQASMRNLEYAKRYELELLAKKRGDFYQSYFDLKSSLSSNGS